MNDDRAALGGWVREVLRKEGHIPTPEPEQQDKQEDPMPGRTGVSSQGPVAPTINPEVPPTGRERAPHNLVALLRSALEDNR